MRMLLAALVAVATLAVATPAWAQTKIGYTNMELVLASMPEAKRVEAQLATIQQKLAERVKTKDDYVKQRYQEYLELKEVGRLGPEDQQKREKELVRLEEELRKLAGDSEYELQVKRQELLEPVLAKLQKAIDEVAVEGGYKIILNQTTSTGVSTILHGPEDGDVTKAIFGKLGIPIPEGL